jgi:hypothetical protein
MYCSPWIPPIIRMTFAIKIPCTAFLNIAVSNLMKTYHKTPNNNQKQGYRDKVPVDLSVP